MIAVALNSSKGKWIMVSTILASAMAFIDGTALNVVLPSFQKNLNATGSDLFWVLNAYLGSARIFRRINVYYIY